MNTANLVVFDLETQPYPEEAILADFDPTTVKFGNIKDADKRAAKVSETRRLLVENAALDALTGSVLVVGFYDVKTDSFGIIEPTLSLGGERGVLADTWNVFDQFYHQDSSTFVGFNNLGFDLPFLCRRSWHLNVQVPLWIFEGRYPSYQFIDLMVKWQCGNRQDTISLDRLARFLGLEGKKHDGKDFARLYAEDRASAIDYLKTDLRLTAACAQKMGL